VLLHLFHLLRKILGARGLPVSEPANAWQGLDRLSHGDPGRGRHRDRELVALRFGPRDVLTLDVALGCLPRVCEHGKAQSFFPVEIRILLGIRRETHFRL
jgi:hypothetical protein